MTTRIREDPTDGWHHITSHRVEQGNLFEDDEDRWRFLRLLDSGAKKFAVNVVSYCLMGNHYHLVLHCPRRGVSHFMHHVNGSYARSYNRRHRRTGPLFTDNFHNVLIPSDGQLLFTTRYIDRNPLELGFDIRTYPWSSYQAYLRPHEITSVVPIRAIVPLDLAGGPDHYRRFVETDIATDRFSIADGSKLISASTHLDPEKALAKLLETSRLVTASAPGTERARHRTARAIAVLIAHDRDIGLREENVTFFGFVSADAYSSFLYRTQTKAQSDPVFFAYVRSCWSRVEATHVWAA